MQKILELDDEKLILKILKNSDLKDSIEIDAQINRFKGRLDEKGN